jgi:hypothetical protein
MATGGYKTIRMLGMAATLAAFALFTGCAARAYSTTVVHNQGHEAQPDDRQADEFIGTPIMGDYDNEEDLDFVLEVNDGAKVFKVEIHERAGGGNRALLEKVRKRVNAMEDAGSIRVIGYYNSEYRGGTKEYGFMDLKMIAFFDEESGKEEAFFTDPQDSQFYTQSDVTVVYAPGHHYNRIHYPMYVSPWWDRDGDGIPNRYDPWPYTYDTWYDYNMNYIPDWYDPYYAGYYSYWDYWHADFWVGYNWYSPNYYHRGHYNTGAYYNDYRTYTRLYDKRHVNNRDNSNRRHRRMDAKSEHLWQNAYERDRASTTRVAHSTPGTRSYRGYESRPVDNRVLVDNSNRSRNTTTGSRDRVTVSTGSRDYSGGSDTFTRNRVTSGNPVDNSRTRGRDVARVATTDKTKTGRAVTTNSRTRSDRASVSSRTASKSSGVRGSEGRTTNSSSRSRNVSSGRTTNSSGRTYKPSSRSRSSSGSSAVRGSSSGSSNSGSSRVRSSSRSKPSTAGSSGGSATRSRSSSGSKSQPAARSSSRSRSSSSGSARSSSSSRSRSSGSSSSKSSSGSSNSRSRSRN